MQNFEDSIFTELAPRPIQSISRDVRGMLCVVVVPLHTILSMVFFLLPGNFWFKPPEVPPVPSHVEPF